MATNTSNGAQASLQEDFDIFRRIMRAICILQVQDGCLKPAAQARTTDRPSFNYENCVDVFSDDDDDFSENGSEDESDRDTGCEVEEEDYEDDDDDDGDEIDQSEVNAQDEWGADSIFNQSNDMQTCPEDLLSYLTESEEIQPLYKEDQPQHTPSTVHISDVYMEDVHDFFLADMNTTGRTGSTEGTEGTEGTEETNINLPIDERTEEDRGTIPTERTEVDADLRCWEHGCNGHKFTTRSNLRRHLREKSQARPECRCPRCGAVFSRTTARNTHVARGSCNRIRRYSNGRIRANLRVRDHQAQNHS